MKSKMGSLGVFFLLLTIFHVNSFANSTTVEYIEAPYVFNMSLNPSIKLHINSFDRFQECLSLKQQTLGTIDIWLELITLQHRTSGKIYPRITLEKNIFDQDVCDTHCPALGCPATLKKQFNEVFLFQSSNGSTPIPILKAILNIDLNIENFPIKKGKIDYAIVDYDRDNWWGDTCTREQLGLREYNHDFNVIAIADLDSINILAKLTNKTPEDFKQNICNLIKGWLHNNQQFPENNETLQRNFTDFHNGLKAMDLNIDLDYETL